MIKKVIFVFVVALSFSNVKAISTDFKYVIDTIGIPQYNVYGQEINEEVYYTYNVFCYSSPKEASANATLKFKSVEGGKWTELDKKYIGIGQAGEYYYIGRNYSGSLISNVCYPVSNFPESTPDCWNYLVQNEASNSWTDIGKYKYVEQLEYMKCTDMLFDKFNYETQTTDPYNLVSYGLTANSIGLNKVVLESCSTWKTRGVLTVKRLTPHGTVRYAIFATAPIATNASVKAKLNAEDSYVISENEKEKNIIITYGAEAINLNEYAKAKHIKYIKAELYINGELRNKIEGSKVDKISKEYNININRENASSYPLYVEVKTEMYTEFAVDGLMRDGLSKSINIKIEKYKEKLEDTKIKLISRKNNRYYASDLIKTNETNKVNSQGIIQAGNHLGILIKTDYDESDIDVYINNEKIEFTLLTKDDNRVYIDVLIDEKNITLKTWNYLRNYKQNYFKILEYEIGQRINNPNVLKIKIKDAENQIYFDVIDKYNMNMNYCINNILNKEEVENRIEIEKWN